MFSVPPGWSVLAYARTIVVRPATNRTLFDAVCIACVNSSQSIVRSNVGEGDYEINGK